MPLPARHGRGRPRQYCGPACKRLGERFRRREKSILDFEAKALKADQRLSGEYLARTATTWLAAATARRRQLKALRAQAVRR